MTTTIKTSCRSWRWATVLALPALLCGILLGGVSAWFLGSVAIAGLTASAFAFNFHIPAALVRLFAIGRVASRYGERLLGHKAALTDQVAHRVDLFAAMAAAPVVREAGWQLGDQARLADYLDDVEDVDYARLRADLPSLTAVIGLAALLAGSAIIAPLSLLPIVAGLLLIAGLGSRLAKTGGVAWRRNRSQRRAGAERLGSAMASALPLRAERLWDGECRAAMSALGRADRETLALRRLQSGFDALASLTGPLAGISVMTAAWLGGARGETLLLPMFLAFAWLAFGETINGASRIVIASLRRAAAKAEIGKWIKAVAAPVASTAVRAMPRELRHARLQRRSPSGAPIGRAPLALRLLAGAPTVLAGASGSGKTSLLKQIAGWIGDDVLATRDEILSPEQRRALTTLVLHDAAILDDTVRANLFAPDCPDAALWRALAAVELDTRIRNGGGLDAWVRQDTLSLGEAQRLNLARAWLSSKPVVLLDEPTEHLDSEQGRRILERLAEHLRGRIVVISTHRPLPLPDSTVIELQS